MTVEHQQICKECKLMLPVTKFPKINKDRRRKVCNRCHRGKQEAARHGMDLQEYLSYSLGPCVFCGDPDTRSFMASDGAAPLARVCKRHGQMFRSFKHMEEMVLCHQIMTRFPFWLKLLHENNLKLFNYPN